MTNKRKSEASTTDGRGKKLRLSDEEGSSKLSSLSKPKITPGNAPSPSPSSQNNSQGKGKQVETRGNDAGNPEPSSMSSRSRKAKIRKLTPRRPWPIVPTSVSATGPRSAHREGKNFICVTRRTGLGAYMRRCKDVIIKDGAMGAAIPLLLQLTCALPPILPFAKDEIKTEVTTGTTEVQDEVLPDDDDEDISIQQRSKSTLLVVLTIGDGQFEGDTSGPLKRPGKNASGKGRSPATSSTKGKAVVPATEFVYAEPEQEDLMEMV
ncbi:hypothetical protein NMY22_g3373 [Coprinellus aureogranulatus]|nr:hypothetical protein NMY22_g3373 [Coprinellus aureogranulatus]